MGNAKSKRREEQRLKDIEDRRARQERERQIKEAEEAEKRKQDFLNKKKEPYIQAACRGYLARQWLSQRRALATRRGNIAREILSTEKSYVASLKVLVEFFYKPLQVSAQVYADSQTRNFKKSPKGVLQKQR